jgi:RNA polymerase sigma-70 factor (ECF subfamily)
MSAAARTDESALIRRIQERSLDRDAAFAELFESYRVRVFTICRHLLRSRADAEDATQEVFLALLRALASFRGESSLGTFIHRIAVRVALKHRLKSSRHSELRVEVVAAPEKDPLEDKEEQRRLWAAMELLSVDHRTVLALFAIDGLGHREIAAILGVPEGTVWSRLHLARKRLAALLV